MNSTVTNSSWCRIAQIFAFFRWSWLLTPRSVETLEDIEHPQMCEQLAAAKQSTKQRVDD